MKSALWAKSFPDDVVMVTFRDIKFSTIIKNYNILNSIQYMEVDYLSCSIWKFELKIIKNLILKPFWNCIWMMECFV